MVIETSIGNYLQNLRKERKMSLRDVADHIGIDVSMLSKIEHGERQLQTHMLKDLCEIFRIDYKMMQIQLLNQKMNEQFGEEPYFNEAIKILAKSNL
jgi:transcriptional regulator with XRE-family HTH domain